MKQYLIEFWNSLGIPLAYLLIGAIGGLVKGISGKNHSIRAIVVATFAGVVTAGFLTAPTAHGLAYFFPWVSEGNLPYAIAYVLGTASTNIIFKFSDIIDSFNLWGLINSNNENNSNDNNSESL